MIDRRQLLSTLSAVAAAPFLLRPAQAAAPASIRLATVKFGSVNWLVETIKAEGFDKKHGFEIVPLEVANNQAGPVALMAGDADVIVSDWTWALRQRAKGDDFKFSSYSSALGSVMVQKDSTITSLADLKGKKLGVAGTAIDKSWILLRAYARKSLGKDITELVQPVFGAPPLISEEFKSGHLDACLNFWTHAARLQGGGAKQLLSMADVLKELGITPTPPLVGFIWSEKAAKDKSLPIDGLLAAAHEANEVLKSDAAWERLKPLVKPATDEEFAAIKAYFRSGITTPWTAEQTASAEKLTKLLIELGDQELVGDGTRFDANLFHVAAG